MLIEEVTYTRVWPDGKEVQVTGQFWCTAPAVRGNRSIWAVGPDRTFDRVVFVSRRHRAVGGYGRAQGRYFDKGENYAWIGKVRNG